MRRDTNSKRKTLRPRVWLYMVDGRNNKDLAKLDTDGFDTWRAHSQIRCGDLVLMYRTAPYSDLAYIFTAISDARPARPSRKFPWKSAVDLGRGFRLRQTIKLSDLKNEPRLSRWSFLEIQRGATSRKQDLQEQGAWRGLHKLLMHYDSGSREYIQRWIAADSSAIFLSYASPDEAQVRSVYTALRQSGIEVWLDRNELLSGHDFDQVIKGEIESCRAMVVCMSKNWLKRPYAQKELEWALALKAKKRNFLFPIRLDDCVIPPSLAKEVHVPLIIGPDKNRVLKKFAVYLRSVLDPG